MLTPMASKTTKKPPPARKTFAEIGRQAMKAAQREALLAACEAHGWNLTAVAEELGMGGNTNVIRALKALAPKEYAKAKTGQRVSPANRREV